MTGEAADYLRLKLTKALDEVFAEAQESDEVCVDLCAFGENTVNDLASLVVYQLAMMEDSNAAHEECMAS